MGPVNKFQLVMGQLASVTNLHTVKCIVVLSPYLSVINTFDISQKYQGRIWSSEINVQQRQ
jgi:hypothetical protein